MCALSFGAGYEQACCASANVYSAAVMLHARVAAVLKCAFLGTGTFAMSHTTRHSQISVRPDDEELDKIEQQLLEFQQKEQHSKHPVM